MNFFRFIAEETRLWMAKLGIRTINELIGRVDLLEMITGETDKQRGLDLSPIIYTDEFLQSKPQYCQVSKNTPFHFGEKAEQMVGKILPSIEAKQGGEFTFEVNNCDRSIGARLSGEIAKRYGNQGMANYPIKINLTGIAGQSLGAWNAGGLYLYLEGDANDYVGKGMAGGRIVLRPPRESSFEAKSTSIMGNTCLYGATGGQLFAVGCAGERFAVRNSGAHAVIEGSGDHCCEYMTGGIVTMLGDTGVNFGAGMTGGYAYVLDQHDDFKNKYNPEHIDIHRIHDIQGHVDNLRIIIEEFVIETDSQWGQQILNQFDRLIAQFWLVKPKSVSIEQLLDPSKSVQAVA